MNDGEELLGKADALLSKYRPAPGHSEKPSPDFPVLTEIVATDVSSTAEPAPSSARPDFPEDKLDKELKLLEEELRQKTLPEIKAYLERHLEELLETRLTSRLAPMLDNLVDEITKAAKEEVSQLVGNAVTHAVEQQMAEIRARTKE